MDGLRRLREILDQTEVLKLPRHRLATFGDTEIHYHLVTPHPELPDRAFLRQGRVQALRPRILTPDIFLRHFEGFGEEAPGFERLLRDHFMDAFKGLEYVFRNTLDSVADHHREARSLASDLGRDLDERGVLRAAVVRGPALGWELSLMKLILEEAGRSFPINTRELDERGLFDPAQTAENRRRREIETLFQKSALSPDALKELAARLKEFGLFDEYQDRFFSLVKP